MAAEQQTYGPSLHVNTWAKPQDLTLFSASDAMVVADVGTDGGGNVRMEVLVV